jgi:hypothetical protein
MSNSYDEIKKLLKSSREMKGNDSLMEVRETLKHRGLINEQPSSGGGYETATNPMGGPRPNLAADTEEELEMSANPKADKQQAYRVSGGVLVMHGKNKGDLEITTEEKSDSLQSLITINNQKLDSLSNLETQKEKDIDVLKSQLSGLSNKNKDLKKKYDAEVALVNSMSNDDIVDVFTETFK